jgi:hypothetical protein
VTLQFLPHREAGAMEEGFDRRDTQSHCGSDFSLLHPFTILEEQSGLIAFGQPLQGLED